jgi:hypothetical protein
MYHIGLQVLRAKIRGFQVTGSTITSRISKSEKERKNRLWNEKRRLGLHCRYHLVAYGLLRGVPYSQIERCAPSNQLNPQGVLDIVLAHNGWDSKMGYVHYDLEKVKKLLETDTQPCASATVVPDSRLSPVPTAQSTLCGRLLRVRKLFAGPPTALGKGT